MGTLGGRKILITGASSGIGKAVAARLISQQAKVILSGRNRAPLEELRHLSKDRVPASIYVADLSKPQQVYGLLAELKENNDIPDSLIHAAGLFQYASITDTTEQMLQDALNLNFIAPFLLTRDWLGIRPDTVGAVIFVNSTAALAPKSNIFSYAASKTALKALADVLYEELDSAAVRVASIYPGRTATPMHEKLCELEGNTYDPARFIDPDTIADEVVRLLTLPANAEIRDLVLRQPRT